MRTGLPRARPAIAAGARDVLRIQQLQVESGVARGIGDEVCAPLGRHALQLSTEDRERARLRQLARLRAAPYDCHRRSWPQLTAASTITIDR